MSDSPSRWHIVGMSMPFSVATVEDRLAVGRGDVGAVDPQGVDCGHAGTAAGSILHTPAGQTRSTMWAMYSSRK